jgi:Tol biopolymer transport system component
MRSTTRLRRRTFAALVAFAASGAVIAAVALSAAAASSTYLTFIQHPRSINPTVAIANIDGTGVRTLGPGGSAEISPDGSEVAVVQTLSNNGGSTLWLYPSAGGAARQILHAAAFISLFGWSADSALLLAYVPSGLKDVGPLLAITAASGMSATIATGDIQGASFSQQGSDDIVYALSASQLLSAPVNLFTSSASGGDTREITSDGHSVEPLWGPNGIVFARFRPRGPDKAPINQLWSIGADGSGARQLTHMSVGPLVEGLAPVAFSADGKHLLAEFGGQDTSAAWTVDLSKATVAVHDLNNHYDGNIANGISRDGKTILLTTGFEGSPTAVQTVPWHGGKPTTVSRHGADASWND